MTIKAKGAHGDRKRAVIGLSEMKKELTPEEKEAETKRQEERRMLIFLEQVAATITDDKGNIVWDGKEKIGEFLRAMAQEEREKD
jgi:hypothetical protein